MEVKIIKIDKMINGVEVIREGLKMPINCRIPIQKPARKEMKAQNPKETRGR
jgi:hypothetical protein